MDLMAFDLLGGGLGNRQQGGVSWKIKGIQTENLSRCQTQGLQFHIVLDQRIGNDDVAWPNAGLNCTGDADIDDAAPANSAISIWVPAAALTLPTPPPTAPSGLPRLLPP